MSRAGGWFSGLFGRSQPEPEPEPELGEAEVWPERGWAHAEREAMYDEAFGGRAEDRTADELWQQREAARMMPEYDDLLLCYLDGEIEARRSPEERAQLDAEAAELMAAYGSPEAYLERLEWQAELDAPDAEAGPDGMEAGE